MKKTFFLILLILCMLPGLLLADKKKPVKITSALHFANGNELILYDSVLKGLAFRKNGKVTHLIDGRVIALDTRWEQAIRQDAQGQPFFSRGGWESKNQFVALVELLVDGQNQLFIITQDGSIFGTDIYPLNAVRLTTESLPKSNGIVYTIVDGIHSNKKLQAQQYNFKINYPNSGYVPIIFNAQGSFNYAYAAPVMKINKGKSGYIGWRDDSPIAITVRTNDELIQADFSRKINRPLPPLPSTKRIITHIQEDDQAPRRNTTQVKAQSFVSLFTNRPKAFLPKVLDDEGKEVNVSRTAKAILIDLTAQAIENHHLDQFYTTEELKALSQTLISSSAMVIGEAGSGKTTLVKALARKIAAGEIEGINADTKIYALDPSALTSGTKWVGSFSMRFNALIKFIVDNGHLLYIDEIHTLKGAGTHSKSDVDAFQRMLGHLSEGYLRVLGSTTTENYNRYFRADPAIQQRFLPYTHQALSLERTTFGLSLFLENNGQPILADEVLEAITRFSERYDVVGAQPRKAIILLREVIAQAFADHLTADKVDVNFVRNVAARIYRTAIRPLTTQEVLKLIDQATRYRKKHIMGWERLQEAMTQLDRAALSNTLVHQGGPRGKFLLTGSKGTGKSYISEVYAASRGLGFMRLHMPQYNGFNGSNELLRDIATAVRADPQGVLLLEEIEKANAQIQNVLLDFLLNAHIAVPEGQEQARTLVSVRVSDTTVFLSSNAGTHFLRELSEAELKKLSQPKKYAAAMEELTEYGLSEFLLDRTDVFFSRPLKDMETFIKILSLKLNQFLDDYNADNEQPLKLKTRKAIVIPIAESHFNPKGETPTRLAIKTLKKQFEQAVANHSLSGRAAKGNCELLFESGS